MDLSQFHQFLIPVSSFLIQFHQKRLKLDFPLHFQKQGLIFKKQSIILWFQDPDKVTIFPVSFRETGKSLPQIWPCSLNFRAVFGVFETRSDIFDRLKTRSRANFVIFEWNWEDLLKIITDNLKVTLFFMKLTRFYETDPFFMKLTRFYETGLLVFPVSFTKFTYFLCKNTSFCPVFVKKGGFRKFQEN